MKPVTETDFASIRLIATDMDGTLTHKGKFTAELIVAIESLAKVGIPVLIVTGRSAGWVSAIANYLPVIGAIAENGGLFYNNQNKTSASELIVELDSVERHRLELKEVFRLLQTKFSQITESLDNRFRITDWTFDIGNLTLSELDTIDRLCRDNGFGFTYSTVQCHIKPQQQDKARGLQQVLKTYFSDLSLDRVLTVGDSPNDESLFQQDIFPLSVGVANIARYSDRLFHKPTYVTNLPEAQGFCELARIIEKNRV